MPTKKLRNLIQSEAYRIVLLQLVGVFILSILALILAGKKVVFLFLLAEWLMVFPIYFLFGAFFVMLVRTNESIYGGFFFRRNVKAIFSAILFLVIVKYLPVSLLSVLVGFVGAIVSFWIVCMWHFSKQQM